MRGRSGKAAYVARRPANVVTGAFLIFAGLFFVLVAGDTDYPVSSEALAAGGAVVALGLAGRALLASVVISDDRVLVRRWFGSDALPREGVWAVVVLDAFDGPRSVRRLALIDSQDKDMTTHYQSPRPWRGGRTTATDRVALAIRTHLSLG